MKKTLISALVVMYGFALFGQEVISTTGYLTENSSGSISYTLGECVISTLESTTSILTQGFHQPIIVEVPPDFVQGLLDIEISVYPNPANEKVTIKVDIPDGLHFMLYDLKGVLVEHNQIISEETLVDLSRLEPSSYLLRIYKSPEETRTFNIIKL